MGMLRTLYAISVVFAHSDWHDHFVFVGGRNAVELFYIISGFLISYILNHNPAYKNTGRFYASRFFRIFPLYYAVAGLTLLAVVAAGTHFFRLYHQVPWPAVVLLVGGNLLIFGQDLVMFATVRAGRLHFFHDVHRTDYPLFQGLLL